MGIYDETDEDRNPHVLKQLSRASGGEAFFPETLQEILPICEQIAHDIRSQYTITFVPTNKKQDGAYRAIDVKAREPSRRQTIVCHHACRLFRALESSRRLTAVGTTGHEGPNCAADVLIRRRAQSIPAMEPERFPGRRCSRVGL